MKENKVHLFESRERWEEKCGEEEKKKAFLFWKWLITLSCSIEFEAKGKFIENHF